MRKPVTTEEYLKDKSSMTAPFELIVTKKDGSKVSLYYSKEKVVTKKINK